LARGLRASDDHWPSRPVEGLRRRPRRHTKVFAGEERVGSRLHLPRRRGVAKGVRRHLVAEADSDRDSFERLADPTVVERPPVPLCRVPRAHRILWQRVRDMLV